MREDQPLAEYRIVLRLVPPIALREASKTERTSFTAWADAVAVIRPARTEKATTLRFMWSSCAFREVILSEFAGSKLWAKQISEVISRPAKPISFQPVPPRKES